MRSLARRLVSFVVVAAAGLALWLGTVLLSGSLLGGRTWHSTMDLLGAGKSRLTRWLAGGPDKPDQALGGKTPRGEPADLLAWQAFTEEGDPERRLERRLALLERAVAARPKDATLRAAHYRTLAALAHEAKPGERQSWKGPLERAAAEGLRADPSNGLYELGLAAFHARAAFERGSDHKLRVADLARAREACRWLVQAATRPELQTHGPKAGLVHLAKKVGLEPDSFVGLVGLIGLWASTELPDAAILRRTLRDLQEHGRGLHRDGRREEAHRLWQAELDLALRYQRSADHLMQLLVGVAAERELRRERIEAWSAEGQAAAVSREWKVLRALDAAFADARSFPQGLEISRYGAFDRLIAPAGGWVKVDPATGRRLDYRALALAAALALALLLLLVFAASAHALLPGQGSAGWPARRDLVSAVAIAVALPLACYLFLDRFHPTRSLGAAAQPTILLQPIALCLGVALLVAWISRRQAGAPAPLQGATTAALAAGTFLAWFWIGPDEGEPNVLRPAVWAGCCLAAAALLAVISAAIGLSRSLRGEAPQAERGAVRFRALTAGTGFVLVLAAVLAVFAPLYGQAARAYHRQVIQPLVENEIGMSRWQDVQRLDRTKAAERQG